MNYRKFILLIYIISSLHVVYGNTFPNSTKSFLSPLSKWQNKKNELVNYNSKTFEQQETLLLARELKKACRMNDIISIGGIRVPDSINLKKSYEFTLNLGKQSMLKIVFFEVETLFFRNRLEPVSVKEYGTKELIFSVYDNDGIMGHGWMDLPSKRIKDIVRIRFGFHHYRFNKSSIPVENKGSGQRTLELLISIILNNEFSTLNINSILYHLSSEEKIYDLSSKARYILEKHGFHKTIDDNGIKYTLSVSFPKTKNDHFEENLRISS